MTDGERPAEYDLAFRVDYRRFFLRYEYAGVRLCSDGLEWTAGTLREGRYADILSIQLNQAYIAKSGAIGACRIVFATGDMLLVTSSTEWGYASDERNRIYADFLADLHARLSDEDLRRINFIGGNSESLYRLNQVALVAAGALFMALPIGLLFWTRDLKALFIAIGGGFLVVPVWQVMVKNEPRRYDPRRLDPDLLP